MSKPQPSRWRRRARVATLAAAFLFLHPEHLRAQDAAQGSAITSVLSVGKSITDGVVSKVEDDAIGWTLGLLGLNPDPDEKIEQEIATLSQEVAALAQQLEGVETSVIAVYKQEIDNEAQDKINVLDAQVAIIQPYWTTYTQILAAGTATDAQISALATGVTSDVASALDAIDLILTTNPSGQEGLIEVYAKVISQNLMPAIGDTEYYSQLHDVMAFYNQWRLNAVTLLVEAYHYEAKVAVPGADPSTLCVNPPGPVAVPCGEAATYASRFFNPSEATATSGVIQQFAIAGGTMLSDSTLPVVAVETVGGVPTPQPMLLRTKRPPWLVPTNPPIATYEKFFWPQSPSTWVSYKNRDSGGWPVDSSGYTDWQFLSMDDTPKIYSAASSYDTLWDALSPYLAKDWPTTVALLLPSAITSSNIWLAEWNGGDQCFMYELALQSTHLNPFCVRLELPPFQVTAEGPFGPFDAYCNPGGFQPCNYYSFSWTGGQGPPLFWTDAASCGVGVSGVNAAGWLKPCGNLWVTDRYGSYFPSSESQSALDKAIAAGNRLIERNRQ